MNAAGPTTGQTGEPGEPARLLVLGESTILARSGMVAGCPCTDRRPT